MSEQLAKSGAEWTDDLTPEQRLKLQRALVRIARRMKFSLFFRVKRLQLECFLLKVMPL